MPLYSFECPCCGKQQAVFRKVDDRHNAPDCERCVWYPENPGEPAQKMKMRKMVEAPAVHADLPGYTSPIDGRWVEGRRARTEDLKRNNCRPWEGMEVERKEAVKRAEAADADFGKKIESGIAEVYNGMSAESQRALQQL